MQTTNLHGRTGAGVDRIRRGVRQPVTAFHWETLHATGFEPVRVRHVATRGMCHERNREIRTDGELVLVLRKP